MKVISGYPKGSEWRKWDLQVHSYLDTRWIWPDGYPRGADKENERREKAGIDLIDHCVKEKIDVVAITDHNSGGAIDPLLIKNNELGSPITILPGVEIISSEGVHLLVIFDPIATEDCWTTWAETIRQFLTAIEMPQPAFQGEGNNVPATSRKSAEDIINKAHGFHALTLFAHVNSANGGLFQKSDGRTRRRLLDLSNILDLATESDLAAKKEAAKKKLLDHEKDPLDYSFINTSVAERLGFKDKTWISHWESGGAFIH